MKKKDKLLDYAKLPNLVIVAVLGFIYCWRKMKAFRPLEGRRCDEIKFEWIHHVDYYSLKPSFTPRIVQNPFFVNMATMVEVFNGAVVKKKTFLLTSSFQNLFVFGP